MLPDGTESQAVELPAGSPKRSTASRAGHEPPAAANSQSIPTSRSQTPHNNSRTRSSTHSQNGSPPLATTSASAAAPKVSTSPGRADHFPPGFAGAQAAQGQGNSLQKIRTVRYDDTPSNLPPTSNPSSSRHRPRGSTRSTSMSGGVQVVLNETGSWSDMANQSQSLVQEERPKPPGMLGFLSRKKGRDRSPKAKERERGVLGKEGARVVVGN